LNYELDRAGQIIVVPEIETRDMRPARTLRAGFFCCAGHASRACHGSLDAVPEEPTTGVFEWTSNE
jgi:hypothetical protein